MDAIPRPTSSCLRRAPGARWLLLLLGPAALVLPRAASGQEVFEASTFTMAEGVTADPTVNLEDCEENRTLAFRWQLDATPAADQRIQIQTNERDTCAAATVIAEVTDEQATGGTQTVEIPARSFLPECPEVETATRYVCLRLYPVAGSTDGDRVFIPVTVDTVAPTPPDDLETEPGDGAVHLSWRWTDEAPDDLASVRITHQRADGTGEPTTTTVVGRTTRTARVGGLQNGVDYDLWLRAVDDAGNVGEESDRVLGTPMETQDFWELYRRRGGAETGGCATGAGKGAAAFLLVAFGAGLFAVRRRHVALGRGAAVAVATAVGLGALSPGVAEAQAGSSWVDPDRRWFLEVDIGPYRPDIDREFEGTGPYEEVFGGGNETMVRLRAERALWQGVGQVGLGLSAGFAQAVGQTRFADGSASPERTAFSWIPLQLSLTYRFDHTALEWGIPLVPYARAGLAYTLWWITGPDGIAIDGGDRAAGGKLGWFYGGGLKFLLNVIDPRLAADFKRSAGVHHTYLYLELTRLQVDGFGADGFDLSASTWFAGLAVEF